MIKSKLRAVVGLVVFLAGGYIPICAQQISPDLYKALRYRHIGPPGNRTAAVVGVPGDPLTYYIGASSGGVWKSSDGGTTWMPVFDDQPAQSIGALAVAMADPNNVVLSDEIRFHASAKSLQVLVEHGFP